MALIAEELIAAQAAYTRRCSRLPRAYFDTLTMPFV